MKKSCRSPHKDFVLAQKLVYDPAGLKAENIQIEKESSEYGALNFSINGKSCKFRVGKLTPKKQGFFFTIWKREKGGVIQPYEEKDPIDFFVFSIHTEKHFGQFYFPKGLFLQKKVLSSKSFEGKRALRVYPPWVEPTSKQAKNTQDWQKKYFLEISKDKPLVAPPEILQRFFL